MNVRKAVVHLEAIGGNKQLPTSSSAQPGPGGHVAKVRSMVKHILTLNTI